MFTKLLSVSGDDQDYHVYNDSMDVMVVVVVVVVVVVMVVKKMMIIIIMMVKRIVMVVVVVVVIVYEVVSGTMTGDAFDGEVNTSYRHSWWYSGLVNLVKLLMSMVEV